MSNVLFGRLTLIGIGLIGSSIAQVVRQKGIVEEITITSRSESTLKRAEELELGDNYQIDIGKSVIDSDLIIICVPVGACESVSMEISPYLKNGSLLTDVGSVKQSVIQQIEPHLPDGVRFVAGHPIAGTEFSGPDAGFPDLFNDRWCILTPTPQTDKEGVEELRKFWESCGSRVEIMEPEHHDLVLAVTSHLPQLISYNIVGTADDLENVTESEIVKYSAAGFRDFTRLAASDPTMWRDVCLHNKDAILEMLSRFSEDLSALRRAVRWEDGDALFKLFSRTRGIRHSIIKAGQESPEPNFGRNIKSD